MGKNKSFLLLVILLTAFFSITPFASSLTNQDSFPDEIQADIVKEPSAGASLINQVIERIKNPEGFSDIKVTLSEAPKEDEKEPFWTGLWDYFKQAMKESWANLIVIAVLGIIVLIREKKKDTDNE